MNHRTILLLAALCASCGGGQSSENEEESGEETSALHAYVGQWQTECASLADYLGGDEPGIGEFPIRSHYSITEQAVEFTLHFYDPSVDLNCSVESPEITESMATTLGALGFATRFQRPLLSYDEFTTDDHYQALRIVLEMGTETSEIHFTILDGKLYDVNDLLPTPEDPADRQQIVNFDLPYSPL